MVALHGRVRSSSLARLQGYNGSWSQDASLFGNQFYVTLLAETWEPLTVGGLLQYKAIGKDMYSLRISSHHALAHLCISHFRAPSFPPSYMAPADLNILWMPDLLAAAQDFAASASAHASTFHSAWSKVCSIYTPKHSRNLAILCFVSLYLTRIPQFRLQVMNADRFDGPYSNLCDAPATAASDSNSDQLYTASQVPPLQPAIPFFYFYFY